MALKKAPILFFLAVAVNLAGCFGSPTFLKQEEDTGNRLTTIGAAVTRTDASVVTASIRADDPRSQVIKIDDVKELKGTSIIVPPGSLAMDVIITIEEAASLATTTIGQQLGISGQFSVTGTAVAVQADQDVTLKKPFGIALPLPGSMGLSLNDPYAKLFVVYKIKIAETGEILIGTIPRSELEIIDGAVRFTTMHLGAFQVAFAEQPVEAKKVATIDPVITKRDEIKATAATLVLEPGSFAKDGYINAAEESVSESLFVVASSSHKDLSFSKILSDENFLICDEKIDYSLKAIAAINTIPSADGAYALCARIVDELKKPHYFKSPIIKKDKSAPMVDAGADLQSSIATSSVNATTSGATKWSWSKISGPGNVTFSSAQAEDTSFAVDAPGSYLLKLTVSDDAGNSASDDVLFVYNPLPVIHSVSLAPAPNAVHDGYLNASEASDSSPLVVVSASNYSTIGYYVVADSTICDGSIAYNAIMPSSQNMVASDGTFAVCVKVSNASGEVAYGKSPSFLRDLTSPSVYVGTNATANATFSRSAATDGVTFLWSKVSGPGTITFSTPTAKSTDITASIDGSYVIRFVATDAAGNQGQGDFTLTWSTVGPGFLGLNKINEASDGYVNASEASSSLPVFQLNASNYTSAQFTSVLADSALNCDVTQNYSQSSIPFINSIPAMDGAYAVCVKLTDAASNVVYGKSDTVIRDVTAPTVDVGMNVTKNAQFTIDAVTTGAITFAWTKQSGPGAMTFGLPSSEDTTVLPTVDGVYVLRLTVTDGAGNSAYDEMTLTWDTAAPVFIDLAKAGDAVDGYINDAEKGGSTPLWALNASGHTAASYTEPLDETVVVTCNAALTYALSTVPGATALVADRPYVICVKLEDAAGNFTYGKSTVVTRDTVAPIFTSLIGANEAVDGYINGSEISSSNIMFALSASGHSQAKYTGVLADSSLICDGGRSYASSTIPIINSTPGAEGAYAVCVELEDNAGNKTYGKSQTIVRDTIAPLVNAGMDRSANATFSQTATSDGISFSWMKTSGPGTINFSNPSALTTAITASMDGMYVIRFKAFDTAGNWAYDEFTLTWDATGPSFVSLLPANGAADGFINSTEKSSSLELFVLSATDYVNALYTTPMLEAGLVCDGGRSYSLSSIPPINSIPPTDGTYAVCVKLVDATSNEVYGKSAPVTLDTQGPTVNLGPDVNHHAAFVLNPTFTDGITFQWSKVSGPGNISFSDDKIASPSISFDMDGSYFVRLTVFDNAGNFSSDDINVNWDTTPPVLLSFTRINDAVDGFINASEASFSSPMYQLTASGYDQEKYTSLLPAAAVCDGSQTYTPRPVPQPNELVTDGLYKVCVQLSDVAGNNTYGSSDIVERDTVPPPGPINVSGAPRVVSAELNFSVTVTGPDVQQFAFRAAPVGTPCSDPSGYVDAPGSSSTINQSAFPDGPLRLCVVGIDLAGNRSPYPSAAFKEWHKAVRSVHAVQVAVGEQHACALFSNNKVRCWGNSTDGQLGYESTSSKGKAPGEMDANLPDVNLGTGVLAKQVAAGGSHTCVITMAGQVKCWGSNFYGQLGIGGSVPKGGSPGDMGDNLPYINLGANARAVKLALGFDHSCALLNTSEVKCWGDNTQAELGTGDQNSSNVPPASPINLGKKAVDISAGQDRTCAVLDDHSIKCWGENATETTGTAGYTFIGAGAIPMSSLTGILPGAKKVLQVETGGFHTCALLDDHKLKCWGRGAEGQLGTGNIADVLSAGIASSSVNSGVSYMRQISLGYKHSCAVMDDFTVKCWGDNSTGQLGINNVVNQSNPMNVSLPKAIQVAAGMNFSCAVLANSSVSCWGNSNNGQLGQGNTTQSTTPVFVNFGTGTPSVLALSSHTGHTCAILSDRSLRCWGNNNNGQLGLGTTMNRGSAINDMGMNLPAVNFSGASVIQVSAGAQHTCALLDTGDMKCWGYNGYGQLGQQGLSMLMQPPGSPINFGTNIKPVKIATGDHQSCALLPDSSVKCWGFGMTGALGQGSTANVTVSGTELVSLPSIDLGSVSKVIDLAAHGQHVCAILDDHSMKCWGDNTSGQLGQPNMDNRGDDNVQTTHKMGSYLPPISLGTNRKVISVALGSFHTCANLDDGTTKCFGANAAGQSGKSGVTNVGANVAALGDNLAPVDLGTNMFARSITAGSDHTCAHLSGGVIKCFGMGAEGALGYESTANVGYTPGQLGDTLPYVFLGSDRFVNQIVAGATHTCAILDIGWIKCWGRNDSGQLGLENTMGQGAGVGSMGDNLDFLRLW